MGLKDWLGGGKKSPAQKGLDPEAVIDQVSQLRRMSRLEEARKLLEENVRRHGDHLDLLKLHWDICVQMERPEAASRSMMRCIQLELRRGEGSSAVFHWFELAERLDQAPRVDLDTRARLAEAMIAGDQEEEAAAFLESVDKEVSEAIPAGALIRVARAALQCRSASGAALAQAVGARSGVPDNVRQEIQALLAEASSRGFHRHSTETVSDAPIELSAAAPAVRKLGLIPAVPLAVDGDQIVLDLVGQGRRKMALRQVQGVAAVRIDDGVQPAWILVDLLLDSLWSDKELIRTVRLRTLDFDPCALVPDAGDFQLALGTFLSNLLAVSQAYPLPDAEAAVGRPFHGFTSIREYEVRVLEVTP